MLKVLLIGEYSGVHTMLASALRKRKGISVFTINDGDSFKNYPADYRVCYPCHKNIFIKIFENHIAFRLGLKHFMDFWYKWKDLKLHMVGYDVVQLINPVMFPEWGAIPNIIILRFLKKNNRKLFLSVLGFDYYVIRWNRENSNSNGFYTPSFKRFLNPGYIFKYNYCMFYKRLNDLAVNYSNAIIGGTKGYVDSYRHTGKRIFFIPMPIEENRIGQPMLLNSIKTISIFHGWQKGKEAFKGNDIFDKVLRKVKERYGDRVSYIVVQDVPYSEYIKKFADCQIFIDQLYANDKGINGLLGMAAGKVVFSGFKEDWLKVYPHYSGEIIGIRAYNDEDYLFNCFADLIDHPDRIVSISENAINFVRQNHSSKIVAQMYIDVWKNEH